jgi:hypothetical protein
MKVSGSLESRLCGFFKKYEELKLCALGTTVRSRRLFLLGCTCPVGSYLHETKSLLLGCVFVGANVGNFFARGLGHSWWHKLFCLGYVCPTKVTAVCYRKKDRLPVKPMTRNPPPRSSGHARLKPRILSVRSLLSKSKAVVHSSSLCPFEELQDRVISLVLCSFVGKPPTGERPEGLTVKVPHSQSKEAGIVLCIVSQ